MTKKKDIVEKAGSVVDSGVECFEGFLEELAIPMKHIDEDGGMYTFSGASYAPDGTLKIRMNNVNDIGEEIWVNLQNVLCDPPTPPVTMGKAKTPSVICRLRPPVGFVLDGQGTAYARYPGATLPLTPAEKLTKIREDKQALAKRLEKLQEELEAARAAEAELRESGVEV